MDSANSGSMQSSSGGDEEYDSRADSITAAFMSNPPPHGGSMAHNSSPAMFDPLSNLFDPLSSRSSLTNPNPLINLDMAWSRNLRSDHNPPDLAALPPNSSTVNQLSGFSGVPRPPGSVVAPNQTDQNFSNSGGGGNVVRNSKKRPRASRRAPTTVLTTDTTNFRAMVQEFTGIPAPPFTATSPFPRSTRFDLFGSVASTIRSATHFDVPSQQPFLLRPFPHRPPFPSPPSSDLGLPKQPPNFLNMQNPVFNLQNMFESSEIQQNERNLKMGALEEFSMSHGHTGVQQSRVPPAEETLPSTRVNNITPPSENWIGDGSESDHRIVNAKLRYSTTANSSEFVGEKAAENVTARSEGMLESWICSSD